MKDWCPIDNMKLHMISSDKVGDDANILKCKVCGYQKPMNPISEEESLILKTVLNSGSSASGASSGVRSNKYILLDPTLPHTNKIPCPNESCENNKDESTRKVVYFETEPLEKKYKYICTVCEKEWGSK